MGRFSIVRPSLLLPLLFNSSIQSTSPNAPYISPLKTLAFQIAPPLLTPFFSSSSHTSPDLFFSTSRPFSSSSGPSNIVTIESDEELNSSLNKVQDDSLPAIFYFTAVWCGPCKFISPFIEELSKKYPHVKTYKIDIDKEGLGNTLSKLKIYSVPTFHFFQNGKRATEIVGADITQLKDTMEKLYKQD
ncbi:hypothetical protein AAC387_Pa07g3179 [Persea americana]